MSGVIDPVVGVFAQARRAAVAPAQAPMPSPPGAAESPEGARRRVERPGQPPR
ncbi:MAG: hypothetical protein OXE75_09555 [bacterium]|nr:hypothetical protein [bacterium]